MLGSTGLGLEPGLTGTHLAPAAGPGVHGEVGHSLHSPSPCRGCLSLCWAARSRGGGDRGNMKQSFLPSSKCLFSSGFNPGAVIHHMESLTLVKAFLCEGISCSN